MLFRVQMCSIITLALLGIFLKLAETSVKGTVKPGSLCLLSMNGKTQLAVATVHASVAAFRRRLLIEIPT